MFQVIPFKGVFDKLLLRNVSVAILIQSNHDVSADLSQFLLVNMMTGHIKESPAERGQ